MRMRTFHPSALSFHWHLPPRVDRVAMGCRHPSNSTCGEQERSSFFRGAPVRILRFTGVWSTQITCLPSNQAEWPQPCHVPIGLCVDAVTCPAKHWVSGSSGSTHKTSFLGKWGQKVYYQHRYPLSLASFHYLFWDQIFAFSFFLGYKDKMSGEDPDCPRVPAAHLPRTRTGRPPPLLPPQSSGCLVHGLFLFRPGVVSILTLEAADDGTTFRIIFNHFRLRKPV